MEEPGTLDWRERTMSHVKCSIKANRWLQLNFVIGEQYRAPGTLRLWRWYGEDHRPRWEREVGGSNYIPCS